MKTLHFDVCVAGAGPAGCVAAYVLARSGARVALCAARRRTPSIGETVSAQTLLLLSRIGIDDCLAAGAHMPSAGHRSIWGSETAEYREAVASAYGCGWHLDRDSFEKRLVEAAVRANVAVFDSSVQNPAGTPKRAWELRIRHGRSDLRLTTAFLIDCTGRRASIAVRLGAKRRVYDKLIAWWAMLEEPPLVPNAHAEVGDRHTSVQATADGWLYRARLRGNRHAVAYFTDGDLLRTRESFSEFLARIPDVSWPFDVEHCGIIKGPARVTATSTRLTQAFGARWLAAGDAANTFDPLSSNGISSAILSGNNSAATLIHASSFGIAALRHYQALLDADYSNYLAGRRAYYRLEERWVDRPFWQRRQLAAPT